MARVAVAMPLYNDERYLPRALDAVCAQTYRDFEMTIVDDGSTDSSAAIAAAYVTRLPLTVIRAAHRGLRTTKRAAVEAASADADYVLILDSDIALPADALDRMVALLDADPQVAAVCAQARAQTDRAWGRGQAFAEDLVRDTNATAAGETKWLVGACVMYRRSVLAGIRMRVDLNEDSDLSLQLRDRYRLLQPRDLVATHFGVPTTLRGLWHRGYRDGVRVRALLRGHPASAQLTTMSRLVPLPLAAAAVAGALTFQPWLTTGALALTAAYASAFLLASRRVPGTLATRLEAAGLFVLGNVGFGVGFLRESLIAPTPPTDELAEPARALQR